MRGTKNKSRQQIQDEIDRLKAQMNVSRRRHQRQRQHRNHRSQSARRAAPGGRDPARTGLPRKRIRDRPPAAHRRAPKPAAAIRKRSPSIAFQRRMNPYPRGDVRYVSTAEEQIEDLKKVTLDDVRKFYQQFYGACVGEIAVVRPVRRPEMTKLAGELFGNWKSPGAYARILQLLRKIEPANQKIETPDKQNAFFMAGEAVKMSDEDPDYPAMLMANYMFGGSGLGTRLSRRIRDKEGLSYGVQIRCSARPPRTMAATSPAFAISNPQNAPKVEASFRDELAKTLKDGFTAEEVAAAKKSWLQERGMGRSQDGALVGLLGARQRFDRTMKFDEAMEAKMAALTPEQITEAFRKHVDPAKLIFVKAGDFKKAGVLQ